MVNFKKLAADRKAIDLKQLVKSLSTAPMEGSDGKEYCAQLLSVIVEQQYPKEGTKDGIEDICASIHKAGAIKPLVQLVAEGNDGAQIYASSTLAALALNNEERSDDSGADSHTDFEPRK